MYEGSNYWGGGENRGMLGESHGGLAEKRTGAEAYLGRDCFRCLTTFSWWELSLLCMKELEAIESAILPGMFVEHAFIL